MASAAPELGLNPYVPRMAAEWDLDAPDSLWREIEATCCFVDISGFTALSERLARRGRIGAEELTEVLNHVFSRMLEVAYSKGGSLLKFGGDALLLMFTGDDHPRMAAEGAVAMRAALREARTFPTSVGRVNLRMSVGIHSGDFHLFRVGDLHRELIITGPAASATTHMEQIADAGEIAISLHTAERLPPGAVGEAKGDGVLLKWRHVVEGGGGPTPARSVPDSAVVTSVPTALRARLAQRGGEAEHRLASVAFVKFQGTDDLLASDGAGATADALDGIVRSVQRAADDESVTFLASDIDANGGKIILTTGVPSTQEDDEGRILRAIRRVMDQQYSLPVRAGVNRGHVFSGDIGTQYRRTFTVMGDTVNLAARLMAAAKPGEIYATATILDQARTHFATEALEPFSVKGKSEPVQAYRVGPATGSRSDAYGMLPFRGRDKELVTLVDTFESITSGRGQTILIDAERGIGKTRLVSEFVATTTPEHVLWLQGEPQSTGIPYQPLRAAVRTVLGIDADNRSEAGSQLLASITKLDDGLLPFAPLLAPIVDAEVPATPESDAIAAEFVRHRVADTVVNTLDAACTGALLVVAEDAHWFDDTTSEICAHLSNAARSRRWLLCATRRPDAEGGFAPLNPEVRLSLSSLTDDVAQELVDAATDTAPLRPHESDGVVARAGGNPLFLEELLRIVRATDIESLPDTLDAVAMREIDALPTTPRRVLRLASVLGRSFDRSLLDQLLAAELVDVGTDALEDLRGLLVPDADGVRIRFRHALLQEAGYQSLPFRQRLELHRIVGEIIERVAAGDDVAPLLSLHFLAAQDWDRTWRYARTAARVAQQAHAVAEVAVHLERAVTAARRLGDALRDDIAGVYVDLGHTLELLGEFERADDAYRRAGAASESDPLQRGQMAYCRAYLRSEFLGRPAAAIRLLRSARAELNVVGGDAAGLQALLLAEEADVRQRQGRLSEALECAGRAARDAEASDEKRALAISLHVRNISLVKAGRADEADSMDWVLKLYEELGDDVKVALTLGNIATVAFFASQWDRSSHHLALCAEASTKAGDLAGAALTHGNLGELRTNQGRLDEAVALLAPARRTLESFGYPVMAAGTAMQLGRARAFLGDLDGGLAMMQAALATFDEIGSHYESLETCARLAEVLVFAGRLSEARNALARARRLERDVGETPLTALIERVELTLTASDDTENLSAALESFPERAAGFGATYEGLVVIALGERAGDRRRHEELVRLTRDLGVVRLPMFPIA
ncbi:MAG TPA: adenylate/guanylate cyclase domain-containing protein [Acidimicrobiales bacterium]|nr:adenylate/guanylate cyclase domain-containing protein [Acidimicrobiales bacterium]